MVHCISEKMQNLIYITSLLQPNLLTWLSRFVPPPYFEQKIFVAQKFWPYFFTNNLFWPKYCFKKILLIKKLTINTFGQNLFYQNLFSPKFIFTKIVFDQNFCWLKKILTLKMFLFNLMASHCLPGTDCKMSKNVYTLYFFLVNVFDWHFFCQDLIHSYWA